MRFKKDSLKARSGLIYPEEDLSVSERKYRLIVDNANEAIVITQDGILKFFNPKFQEITRYTRDELEGMPFTQIIHPEDKAMVLEKQQKRLKGLKKDEVYSFRITDKEGITKWVEIKSISIIWDEKPATLNFISDITHRKEEEKLREALYKIATITNLAEDLQEFYAAIHDIVGELMYAKNFYIALFDEPSQMLSFAYFVDEHDPWPPPRKLGRGLTEYVLRTGKPLICTPDLFYRLEEKGKVELIGTPAVSWLGVPLKRNSKTLGIIVVQSYTEDVHFGKSDKELLTFVSQHLSTAIERKNAEQELKESEMRFRMLVQSANEGIVLADSDGKIISWNRGAQGIFGYSEEEALGKPLQILMPERLREAHQRGIMRMQSTGFSNSVGRRLEMPGLRRDGSEFPLELSITAWRVRNKIFLASIMRDITDRKKQERALRESEERFRSIVENSHEGIMIIDDSYRFVYVNDQLCEILGYPKEEIIGHDFREFLDKDSKQLVAERYRRRQRGEKVPPRYEFKIVRKNGERRYVELSSTTIQDFDGKIKTVGQILDITDRKDAERKLREGFERLRKTMEGVISAMAGIVETRDPYTAGHQQRVAKLACAIAKEMGLPQEKIQGIRMAALIHDIGKIYVPAEILSKPVPLTKIEKSLIETHPQVGYDILKNIEFPWPVAQIVLQHHERMDGSGYPNGLKGDQILLEARIIGVADVVEAMSSYRPYRPAIGIKKALEEIKKKRGILYDPEAVDACLKVFREKKISF